MVIFGRVRRFLLGTRYLIHRMIRHSKRKVVNNTNVKKIICGHASFSEQLLLT